MKQKEIGIELKTRFRSVFEDKLLPIITRWVGEETTVSSEIDKRYSNMFMKDLDHCKMHVAV